MSIWKTSTSTQSAFEVLQNLGFKVTNQNTAVFSEVCIYTQWLASFQFVVEVLFMLINVVGLLMKSSNNSHHNAKLSASSVLDELVVYNCLSFHAAFDQFAGKVLSMSSKKDRKDVWQYF